MRAVYKAKLYDRCVYCGAEVRVNKPLFGDLHFCLTECQRMGRHLDEQTRIAGPFWRRRLQVYCAECKLVLDEAPVPKGYKRAQKDKAASAKPRK